MHGISTTYSYLIKIGYDIKMRFAEKDAIEICLALIGCTRCFLIGIYSRLINDDHKHISMHGIELIQAMFGQVKDIQRMMPTSVSCY